MKFHTDIQISKASQPIEHSEKILMLGSCFAENMEEKFANSGFRVCCNPFGTLYNPLSIAACLQSLIDEKHFSAEDLHFSGGQYHSMLHHGRFSSADADECLGMVNESIRQGRMALQEADRLIITWGTAWVYEMEGKIVGNCHKLPASCFLRRRLTIEEIIRTCSTLFQHPLLREKKVLITVSPIRHIKDGLHENQLSKATLLLAADQLVQQANWTYFPAYELMLDELRDYRFYAADMVHPSPVAIDYVWERFAETQFSENAQIAAKECEPYFLSLAHRPLHPESAVYQQFRKQMEARKLALSKKYPYLHFEEKQ